MTISASRTSWRDCCAYLPSVTKVTPSGDTRRTASLPRKPVRYRMLVIRTQRNRRTFRLARTPRSLRTRDFSAGAWKLRRANSAFPAEVVEYCVESKDVPEPAESRDPADRHVLDQGLPPERFPAGGGGQGDVHDGEARGG